MPRHEPPTFLRTAAEILSDPDVQAAQARECVRLGIHAAEVARSGGVSFGMGPGPIREKTVGELIAEGASEKACRTAWLASPRGRYMTALRGLEEIGYFAEADAARSAYYRGMADERQSPSIGEIAVALRALNDVPGEDAIAARGCLSELLLAVHARRAA